MMLFLVIICGVLGLTLGIMNIIDHVNRESHSNKYWIITWILSIIFCILCVLGNIDMSKHPSKYLNPNLSDVPEKAHIDTIYTIYNQDTTKVSYKIVWNE